MSEIDTQKFLRMEEQIRILNENMEKTKNEIEKAKKETQAA